MSTKETEGNEKAFSVVRVSVKNDWKDRKSYLKKAIAATTRKQRGQRGE